MLVTSRNRVRQLFDEGQSEQQLLTERRLAGLDKKWSTTRSSGKTSGIADTWRCVAIQSPSAFGTVGVYGLGAASGFCLPIEVPTTGEQSIWALQFSVRRRESLDAR